MASLNASAMLAASYEVERHMDMQSMYEGSTSDSSSDEADAPPSPKKVKDAKGEQADEKATEVSFCSLS